MASALYASLMYRCEPKVARACLHRNFIFVLSSKADYVPSHYMQKTRIPTRMIAMPKSLLFEIFSFSKRTPKSGPQM